MSITAAQLLCLHHLKRVTDGVDNSNRTKTYIDEVVIIPKFTIDGDDRVRKYILYIMFFIQFRWLFITHYRIGISLLRRYEPSLGLHIGSNRILDRFYTCYHCQTAFLSSPIGKPLHRFFSIALTLFCSPRRYNMIIYANIPTPLSISGINPGIPSSTHSHQSTSATNRKRRTTHTVFLTTTLQTGHRIA